MQLLIYFLILGLATAKAFAKANANIILLARNQSKAENVQNSLKSLNSKCSVTVLKCDLMDVKSIDAACKEVLKSFELIFYNYNN